MVYRETCWVCIERVKDEGGCEELDCSSVW